MRYLLSPIAAFSLLLPAIAQDQPTTAVQARNPLLVVKTADARIAKRLARSLEYADSVPALEEGSHYVLELDAERKATIGTASDSIGYLELSADPGGLMQAYAQQVDAVRPMMQGAMVMAMSQQGISAKDAMKAVQAMLDFPQQLERLTVHLATDPKKIHDDGLAVDIGFAAKAGTPCADVLALLRPCSQGTPLQETTGALLQCRYSFDPKPLAALIDPLMEFALPFAYHDAEARKAAQALFGRMVALYDGGGAAWIGDGMGMNMLIGFLDATDLAGVVSSADYLKVIRSQDPATRDMEIEITPDAFEHRGAKFFKTRITNDGPPNPMMPDGVMETFTAAVDNFMVLGATEASARKITDAVFDKQIPRAALPDGAVATVDIRLGALLDALAEAMPMVPSGEGVPENASLMIVPKGRLLTLRIRAK